MAIADEAQIETFTGNASSVTAYAIPFAYRATDDLVVTRIDADGARTLLVEGDDYTVTGQNLVTVAAIPITEDLEVERDTPLTQDLDTESPAGSFITAIEGRLDRIVMGLQDTAAKINRYLTGGGFTTGALVTEPAGGLPAVGDLGETRQALRALLSSPLSLTSDTSANIASIELTAGDWDVEGIASFSSTAATEGNCYASLSTTSAELLFDGREGYATLPGTVYGSIPITRRFFQIAATTTVYLVGNAYFEAGAITAGGAITARRVR